MVRSKSAIAPRFGIVRIPRPLLVLLALTLACSLAPAVDSELYFRLALVPERVWQGEVWRLATWAFVEAGPISLVLACLAIYFFGGALVIGWGARRFARYVIAVIAIAGVGTVAASVVIPGAARVPHLAGFAFDAALVIAWALTFPDRRLRLYYGLLVIGGPMLAHGIALMTVLFAVFWGVAPFLPELFACAVALIATSRWWRQVTRKRTFRSQRGGRHGGSYYA